MQYIQLSMKPMNDGQKSQEMTQLAIIFLSSVCSIHVTKDSIQTENS